MRGNTLINYSLAGLILFGMAARAEHGGTKDFEEKMRALRKEVEGKVRYERLNPEWAEDAVFYKREGGSGWIRVDLKTGERSEVEKKPKTKGFKAGQRLCIQGEGPGAPAGIHLAGQGVES